MIQDLSFGQRIDPENGFIECWFTHDALDEIKKMDLSDKVVWMFGSGMGNVWLAKRCKHLHIVERVAEWIYSSQELAAANNVTNIIYYHRPCNDSSGMEEMYCEIPDGIKPDIIINDDAYRYEVCVMAEKYFKENGGGILITDNWQQSYVFMCPTAAELLYKYDSKIFEQADHLDNDGINKWKTAIHFIK